MAKGPAFKLYRDQAGEYRWTLLAANGEPIADSSEGYTTKFECKMAIGRVRRLINVTALHLHDLT